MTVAELKKELEYYDDDMEVVFNLDDTVEVDRWSEDKWGNKSVDIDAKLKPAFIGTVRGDMLIDLEVIMDS